ncbi:heat shock protein 67B2 [Ceratitis capitata]|uniref:(Mediterranean fruit fly) hypothetical protein n=1 Tax=Ceratitis capitata TaxID=7213 RepID=A0A811U966_CERCA|nr:heat shock protein 67B2 [Ceratitis capitata]CAD6993883.1 unnamed protein product [Ceratitis capitata]
MMSKIYRFSRIIGGRYVNACDLAARNFSLTSLRLDHFRELQRNLLIHDSKCDSSSNNQQIKSFSTGNSYRKEISSVNYSYVKELPNRPEKLLIDVRERQELEETGKIPTSINIPLDSVSRMLAEDVRPQVFQSKFGRRKPSTEDEIIFTCKLGKRALKAAEIANAMGFKNVKFYEGSWDDWVKNENEKQ